MRLIAENVHGVAIEEPPSSLTAQFETSGNPSARTFAVHSLQGEAIRALGVVRPHGLDTHYHFEYATQEQFEKSGFADASATPELDVSAGESSSASGVYPEFIVGEDLPGLRPGVTYHYRLSASNGVGSGVGEEQTLEMPARGPSETSPCPNERLRTGPSAALPDCRAYEQVTPVRKGRHDGHRHVR